MAKKIAIRGEVTELDRDGMTFKMQPIYGQKVSGPVPEQCYDAFVAAINGHKDAARVLIEGVVEGAGKHITQDGPLALESVERVTLLHPLDFHARLDEFRNMQDGWYDGEDGKAPPHSGLDWLSEAFRHGYPDDIPLPYTYPTFDGGVQCEWGIGQFCLEIEIDLDARKGEWLWFDLKANFLEDYEDKVLNLDDPGAWAWMANRIRETLEQAE